MNKKLLLKAIQYLNSKDYIHIMFCYPGVACKTINSKEALLAITDVDKLCAEHLNMTKAEFVKTDEKEFIRDQELPAKYFPEQKRWQLGQTFTHESPEVYVNERHRGLRFYAWYLGFSDSSKGDSIFSRQMSLAEFGKLSQEEKRDYLEINSHNHSWSELRELVLDYFGSECFRCGDTKGSAIDHILPRSKYPELEKDFNNFQILCRSCNSKKGNRHIGSLKIEVTEEDE